MTGRARSPFSLTPLGAPLVVVRFARLGAPAMVPARRDQRHLKPSAAFAGNGRPQGSSSHRPQVGTVIAFPNGLVSLFTMVLSLQTRQTRTTSDCRSLDELTGGRFAVTIIRGLLGGGSRCGRHQLVVARRRCLRSIRPLARGRSAFYVFLKRHRSERGGRVRAAIARTFSMAGVA